MGARHGRKAFQIIHGEDQGLLHKAVNQEMVFGGIDIGYAFTPIDEHSSWIWTRYTHAKLSSYLGGAMLSRLFALIDYLIFNFQDIHVLRSQLDSPGDISKFHLYEADRAIGLFFGMVKRAMLEAERPDQKDSARQDQMSAAAGR